MLDSHNQKEIIITDNEHFLFPLSPKSRRNLLFPSTQNGSIFPCDFFDNSKKSQTLPRISQERISSNSQGTNKIVIDLQKEYDEDLELLEMLEEKPKKSDKANSNIKLKVLCELKKSKCEIIPEEDEDKQKTENRFYKAQKESRNIAISINQSKSKKTFRKIQIDTSNQIKPEFILCGQTPVSTTNINKMNQEKERREISNLLTPSNNINRENSNVKIKKPINIERSIESPSTSEFTHDTTKKSSTEEGNYWKERHNVFSARNSSSNTNAVAMNQNVLFPLMTRRPMSNLSLGGNAIWKKIDCLKEDPEINQKLKDIMGNISDIKKTISQKKKQRCKLGSAPVSLNELNNERNHKKYLKLKIEGLQSTKNEKKMQIDLSGHLYKRKIYENNGWNSVTNKNNINSLKKKNDPIKIVKKY